jgi:hypothetical protein
LLQSVSSIANQQNSIIAAPMRRSSLINKSVDTFLIGGASLLVFVVIYIVYEEPFADSTIIALSFNLAFAVNFPHFLLSYQLLYIDFRHLIFKQFRFFWAGIIVPIILACVLIVALYHGKSFPGYFVNAMFFFVGWHYVKQIFGGVVVMNALRGIYYNKMERWALQANLYSIWAISWVFSNFFLSKSVYYGFIYESFNFSPDIMSYCYLPVGITLAAVLITHLHKYFREHTIFPLSAIVCYLSIYVWFIPIFYNPTYYYTVPFFHSLQYLLFVYAFRRNKVQSQTTNSDEQGSQMKNDIRLYGYLLLSVVLGAIFFSFLPNYLDSLKIFNTIPGTVEGAATAMFVFTIFINIHHYFIDNVIWKGSNPEIKEYIFEQSQR